MAAALWDSNPELARRYAEVLRTTAIPAGLSDAEKRVAFLREIEDREAKDQSTRPAPETSPRMLTVWPCQESIGGTSECRQFHRQLKGLYSESYGQNPHLVGSGSSMLRTGKIVDEGQKLVGEFEQIIGDGKATPVPSGFLVQQDELPKLTTGAFPVQSWAESREIKCECVKITIRTMKPEDMAAKVDAESPQHTEPAKPEPAMLKIKEAAAYCQVTAKTIRNRLNKVNGDGSPLLAGVIGIGRLTRIPRASLEPFRKTAKAQPTPRKRKARKAVKRKS